MKRYVIVVAGGKGLRMGGDLPKQFMPLDGKPVLMRTLENFYACNCHIDIILVLPVSHQEYWRQLCDEYSFDVPHRIADGGDTRFDSVRNGLAMVDGGETVVGVHDGVRPFVSHEVIENCYTLAEQGMAVVPVVDVVETLRKVDAGGDGSITVPRSEYRLVQTPQVFPADMLKKAYTCEYRNDFTDDASVVEYMGCKIVLAQGNRENIKLTTPFDMKVAEALL